MKCTKIVLSGLVAFTATANAMPTPEETKKAEPLVMDLMRADQDALKSGKKTRVEAAQSAMEHAKKAESEAAKLLLMKGAFNLYARAGEFDKAIETLQTMQTAIPDMPPQSVTNMIETALRGTANKKDAARLYKLLDEKRGTDTSNVEYKFSYRLDINGEAILTGMPCVSPKPEGVLIVPSIIDGHKVTMLDEHNSFVNCDKMTKIVLPAGLEFVGHGSFLNGCSSLADIEISETNPNFTSFKGVLYSKDMKNVVAYPKARDKLELSPQTKIIGRRAFGDCTFIKELVIPSGIERIESHAFAGMPNLEKIVFPASVNEISWQMFQGDSNLRKIIFMGNAPEVRIEEAYGFFAWAPENIVIEVKKGTKGWNGMDSTDIPERWPKSRFGYRDTRPIRFIGEARGIQRRWRRDGQARQVP